MTATISQERTRNYLRQIKGAAVYKALAMIVSFLYIPLMIGYLGQEKFGIWATLLSILSWAVFFDLGVGNGMRNKVAEVLAKGEQGEAGKYVASGYTLIGIMVAALWLLFMLAAIFVPWQRVFNTAAALNSELRQTVQIASTFILFNFWLGLVSALLGAVQRTAIIALGQLLSNGLAFLLVLMLSLTEEASLPGMAVAYGVPLVAANLILSSWFYRRHPELRPRWHLDSSHAHPLLTLGIQFFTIQLAVLVIFTTDKLLITQLFGPEFVTPYEVVFKLFSIITFAHTLISAPLWSAYTDAYHRKDAAWIRNMLRNQMKIYAGVVLAALVFGFLAQPVISVWIGPDLRVPSLLIVMMGLFVAISTWNNIFAMFINGTGQMKIQLYTAIIAMLVNIPLALFFARYYGMDTSGIVLATCVSLSLAAVMLPIQTYRLLNRISEGSCS